MLVCSNPQGAKKTNFLPSSNCDVPPQKIILTNQKSLSLTVHVLLYLNFPKKFSKKFDLPIRQVTEFTNPSRKSACPRLLERTFFTQ